MYERRHQPLLPFNAFVSRLLRSAAIAGATAAVALGIDILVAPTLHRFLQHFHLESK